MKKAIFLIFLTAISMLVSCSPDREKAKSEILETEKDFEKMVAARGMAYAFSYYAADHGVVNLNGHLLRGKEAIRNHYMKWEDEDVSLKWEPEYMDVASSGDMGYTFGRYTFTVTDYYGKVTRSEGIFHRVWKKQDDGTWRFVWD